MSNSKIWLSSPHMGGNELKYIHDAFDTNWVAPLGPNVDAFEKSLEEYFGDVNVAATTSGTAALHLALIMLGVQRGDEVICQSFTFAASANPIAYLGAEPIFVDSENETWNMCPQALEDALTQRLSAGKKPKAIIFVHSYGMPAKINEIAQIAQKYEIPLVEDAAEAFGSRYQGRLCGTFGDFSILSFNGNKIITTSQGGALVCRTNEDKQKAVYLSSQARDEAPHYEHSQIGYNYRMSNICAGVGRGQLEVIDKRVEARRNNQIFYKKLLEHIPGINVLTEPTSDFFSNHWLTAITIAPKITGFSREDLRHKFLEDNIESRPLWKPMHLQTAFKDAAYFGGNISKKLFEDGLCLPSGSNLVEEEKERIKKVLEYFLHK